MSIWQLIGRSYTLPFQRFGVMARVFWLPALVWIAVSVGAEWIVATWPEVPTDDASDVPIASQEGWSWLCLVVAYFYQSFVMASGLIRWHGYLVRDDPALAARAWLRGDEWRFWRRWSWLGLAMTLLAIAIGIVLLFTSIFGSSETGPMGELPPSFATILVVSFIIAMALSGLFFPRTFLSLVAIAVKEVDEYRKSARKWISRLDCLTLAFATLVTTAPPILIGMALPIQAQEPLKSDGYREVTMTYMIASASSIAVNFMAIIIFATMLSLFYRERVAPPQPASASL